jgi:F-type H+-transporting ATPase subunit epsilon
MAEAMVNLELVTPSRLVLSVEADMVVVPGGDGDFGVLPGHAPLLSTVRPGVLDVYRDDAIESRIFVAGGFAEVVGSRMTVLAEEAVPLGDIDATGAAARLERAREAADSAADDAERRTAEAELAAAEAMLAAAGEG